MKSKLDLSKIPSFAWIFIFLFGIAAFIIGITFLFWMLSSVEGFASVVMLLAGGAVAYTSSGKLIHAKDAGSKITVALAISFFAIMGMAIDQTGNVLYNKPLEILFCPPNSFLNRGVTVLHPTPGRTDVIQDYTCYEGEVGKPVKEIDVGNLILVRLIEYILLGYLLAYTMPALRKFIDKRREVSLS